MLKDPKKIIDIISNNEENPELEIMIENEISSQKPFDHDNGDALTACGINHDELAEKMTSISSKSSCFSAAVEEIEKTLSKRELAFMLTVQFKEN